MTYVRVYQGRLSKGMYITNTNSKKKVKVPRLVRMHSNEMVDIDSVEAGDVVAVFGVECASMDTFTDGTVDYSLTSMFVPNPVMSLAIKPKESAMMAQVRAPSIYICIPSYIHTYIHTYMHTYIHTYMDTYIHSYIHS